MSRRRQWRRLVLATELLKRLALGLGDAQRGEAAEQHEEGEDLEHVVQPRAVVVLGGAARLEGRDGALADDGADLARGGRDTVGRGPVARREHLARHDEGGGVGAEVEEELGQDIDDQEAVLVVCGDPVVGEAHDHEEDGEDDEAHHLDRLAAKGIDGGDSNPVARHGAGQDNNEVADGSVEQDLVGAGVLGRVADDLKDGGVVQG